MKKYKELKYIVIAVLMVICSVGFIIYYFSLSPKRTLEKQVMKMTGINVDLSFEKAKIFFNGVDSSYTSMPKKKFVVFVDSTSCSGCTISHLIDYYEINDTLRAKGAEMLVVLNPERGQIDEVFSRLNHEKFPFWYIVDVEGEFDRNNPWIPDNKILHVFTTDEQDKIILVGNPIQNNRIKELLFKTLQQHYP
ncbi:MAG: hypothetical protein K2L17_03525 [Muribaculaceae bacterium]|nr:hypothetical protein [Muribaculaceae bacterium]